MNVLMTLPSNLGVVKNEIETKQSEPWKEWKNQFDLTGKKNDFDLDGSEKLVTNQFTQAEFLSKMKINLRNWKSRHKIFSF